MADRTLASYTEPPTRNLWTHTARIERLSSGRPGILVIVEVTDPSGYTEEGCVVIEDGHAFLEPVLEWLNG